MSSDFTASMSDVYIDTSGLPVAVWDIFCVAQPARSNIRLAIKSALKCRIMFLH
jgi:hypothetical protein